MPHYTSPDSEHLAEERKKEKDLSLALACITIMQEWPEPIH
jgi:hypothetical protein